MLHILVRDLLPKSGFLLAPFLNMNSCFSTGIVTHSESDQLADLV